MWRYSLRWCLPHKPCPGPIELLVMEVPAGTGLPDAMHEAWQKRPQGYGVCLDFPQSQAVRRWSAEAKARVRRQKLAKRVQKAAPLFADELIARELEQRPEYFKGQ
ncbi:TPA: theronine dehydrogenase [Pseudomonas aeruginosa]|nr:theronine dehydrogenase [Pseudomonas paraeruginosa]HBP1103724.1 theronine dehydrogenase [Pseudomonas aeruginosa]HBP1482831.1 theronine dehydrogenase [Pseudomonas aeruginosa]